ncbi:MAG: carbonic anhydrase [Candidatus Eisenbacteria bacterium]|uniref:carbonic anhydrase n=1 Tax=Eiseniibacteriota bacterium TaxID=2212470 RepID=A0A849T2B6_UNCEI|nr:carbonic anhydrase [Candidatus Eisenbacteria bacterium]
MSRIRACLPPSLVVALLLSAPAAGRCSAPASSSPADSTATRVAPTPLARLQAGNRRFVANAATPLPVSNQRRSELAKGQAPFAIVLTCADSRVPPELIFNAGLGDLFVVRAAGEVIDRSVLASVEYAAEHLHAPLLVVMGHEACGAVKAAMGPPAPMGPNLDYLVGAIRPAVARVSSTPEARRLEAAIKANVEQVIGDAIDRSDVLSHLIGSGKLKVVGAYYELASGRVVISQAVDAAALPHATAVGH